MSLPVGPPKFQITPLGVIILSSPYVVDGEYVAEGNSRTSAGVINWHFKGWRWQGQIRYEAMTEADWTNIRTIFNSIVSGTNVMFWPHSDDNRCFLITIEGSLPEQYIKDQYIARRGALKIKSKGYVTLIGAMPGNPIGKAT